jgi:hypothetical protein
MTTASLERQRIAKFLRLYGSGTGQLVRVVGTTNQSTYSVSVRAHVRLYLPEELTTDGNIMQGDSKVIVGFDEIDAVQWPGASTTPMVPGNDPRVARNGDKFIWKGKSRTVLTSEPIYFNDVGIRQNIQIRG